MQLLFKDYTDLVIKAYEEKRDSNQLSQLLMHPTAANIRQECFNVYTERIKKGEEEENTLRAFFGVPPAGKNFGYVIERYNADKFRPLQSLMKGEIKNPALVNVELLAWLIDFIPRPLAIAQKIPGNTIEAVGPDNPRSDSSEDKAKPDQQNTRVGEMKEVLALTDTVNKASLSQEEGYKIPKEESMSNTSNLSTKNLKTMAAVVLILVSLFGGGYIIKQIVMGRPNTACMYWASDHYEEVPCNEDAKGRFIIPVNKENKLRRITREDTITERSIGKVYYLKDSNRMKYYTEGGSYPEDVTRSLKVLSRRMFENYIGKKETPGKDSLAEQNREGLNNK